MSADIFAFPACDEFRIEIDVRPAPGSGRPLFTVEVARFDDYRTMVGSYGTRDEAFETVDRLRQGEQIFETRVFESRLSAGACA